MFAHVFPVQEMRAAAASLASQPANQPAHSFLPACAPVRPCNTEVVKFRMLLLALTSAVVIAGCRDARPAKAVIPEPDAKTRLENYQAKKWVRFAATMFAPTKDGQIMSNPKGEQIHIVGDLGIAKGELFHGYFERAGNYDYKRASGAAERLPNYEIRARAHEDMGNDFLRLLKLNNQRLKGRLRGPPFDEKLLKELVELHVRLEGEGCPEFKLD